MPVHRFPILIWQDAEGLFNAATVDGASASATDATASGATQQLKTYLEWAYRKDALPEPDFRDARLMILSTTVRPQYKQDERAYPCDDPWTLRTPCVVGATGDGGHVCAAPTLGIRIVYERGESAATLLREAITQQLAGVEPRVLSRLLLPHEPRVEELLINVKTRRDRRDRRGVHTLETVAEPIAGRGAPKKTSRAWNRDELVARVVKQLANGQNLLLLGPPGVGKTTVLHDAIRVVERDHPPVPLDGEDVDDDRPKEPRFWRTSAGRLIAGMQYLGQWEERCEEVVAELRAIRGVLCLENLLDLVRTGGQSAGSGLAAFFGAYLERSELQMVIEATPEQLDACRRLLPGFAEHFRVVDVPEFGASEAREVLARLAEHSSQRTKVEVGEGVVELVYRLFRRFQPYEAFPGKTGTFLRQAFDEAAKARLATLDRERIVDRFATQTGVPEKFLRDDVLIAWDDVHGAFRQKIIGQDDACRTAADLVATFKAGLNDPHRPLGAYLFCGPTGVGKTELAKTLASYLFERADVKESFVRLDMSEYSGYGAAERLIIQPDGRPSRLIKQVRRRPFCVVLLDEVEKAAPEVFDVLLGVFDEGRLTDRFGRTTIFRSAVVIMTSNLGATAKDSLGFDGTTRPSYEREALGFFRPEFVNRLDGIVTFAPLSEADVLTIAEKELREIAARDGLARADLKLAWSETLVRRLAREGWDARFGARPLQRTLERRVVAPLARWLVENPAPRKTTLRLDADPDGRVTIDAG